MNPRTRKPLSPVRTSYRSKNKSFGSSPLSAREEERIKHLTTVFTEIDENKDKKVSFEELHRFLTMKQGETFDLILCQELFARMDLDNDAVVSIEEFVANYVEVENLILRQIREVAKEIKGIEAGLRENQEKLKKAKEGEVIRSNGIMQGSQLTVNIKSALNLIPTTADGLCNAFAVLECETNSHTTRVVPSNLNPTWDEIFDFPINSKASALSLTIYSKSALGTKFVGKATVQLGSLADQTKTEQYYNLSGEKGEAWQGKVLLEHIWIWSEVRYYSDIIIQQEKFIKEDLEKIESLKAQGEKLMKPFKTSDIDFIYEPSGIEVSDDLSLQHQGSLQHQASLQSRGKSMVEEWSDSRQVMISLIYAYIILSVLNNFKRTDFLNTTACVIGYWFWMFEDANGMKVFLAFLLLSEVLDLVWIIVWGAKWLMVETEALMLGLFLIGFKGILAFIVAKSVINMITPTHFPMIDKREPEEPTVNGVLQSFRDLRQTVSEFFSMFSRKSGEKTARIRNEDSDDD